MRGFIALLVVFGPAMASAGYLEFHIDGFVRSDIEQLERRIIRHMEKGDMNVVIDLNSTGGDLSGLLGRSSFKQGLAYKIEALKEAGLVLTTQVGNGSTCESACTALFTLGDHRIASSRSLFMFHAVRVKKAGDEKKKYQKMYAERWLRVIHSVDRSLAKYLDDNGWFITKRRDWEVSARRLKSRFGNYITRIR